MKTPSDRIAAIERSVNSLTIKALSLRLALSKGEFREEDHPRDADGKFGSGGGSGKKEETKEGGSILDQINQGGAGSNARNRAKEVASRIKTPDQARDDTLRSRNIYPLSENEKPVLVNDKPGTLWHGDGVDRSERVSNESLHKYDKVKLGKDDRAKISWLKGMLDKS